MNEGKVSEEEKCNTGEREISDGENKTRVNVRNNKRRKGKM